jgi:hypothetical protein
VYGGAVAVQTVKAFQAYFGAEPYACRWRWSPLLCTVSFNDWPHTCRTRRCLSCATSPNGEQVGSAAGGGAATVVGASCLSDAGGASGAGAAGNNGFGAETTPVVVARGSGTCPALLGGELKRATNHCTWKEVPLPQERSCFPAFAMPKWRCVFTVCYLVPWPICVPTDKTDVRLSTLSTDMNSNMTSMHRGQP